MPKPRCRNPDAEIRRQNRRHSNSTKELRLARHPVQADRARQTGHRRSATVSPCPGALASDDRRNVTGRPSDIGEHGRYIYGPTPPSSAVPWPRTTPLSSVEVDEVVDIIAQGRAERRAVELPERLRTRDWGSVETVSLALDARRGLRGVGWKIGAASQDIRRAEGVPGPSPGRIYDGTVFPSGASLGPEFFINYRNIECEFAFRLGLDFPVREEEYTEADAAAGIDALFPRSSSATPCSSTGTAPAHILARAWTTAGEPLSSVGPRWPTGKTWTW